MSNSVAFSKVSAIHRSQENVYRINQTQFNYWENGCLLLRPKKPIVNAYECSQMLQKPEIDSLEVETDRNHNFLFSFLRRKCFKRAVDLVKIR